ncbi:trypsin-like peptidase domain-containing protein [uncultured Endozoicomonas sp.]|uniref:S1C family serine protease n=1 Tax=uncultured Endozoicomonas sp. TaxID=432652 RepID=UPI00262538CF|nr:trypsin-like peptidase domain-containing protein [uncultured Endozoicomonas sp.]
MKKLLKSVGLPIAIGLFSGLIVLLVVPSLAGISERSRNQTVEQFTRVFNLSGQVSYSDAVKRAAPAVVSISTTSVSGRGDSNLPLPERNASRDAPEGSGVIVSPDGYILTNHHVIQNASRLLITLLDGREIKAALVGTDPESDLAVLKIGLKNLPYLNLVDSSKAEIGDVVLAIGNPFGLGQTVTMGIISATGRNDLQLNIYEDFIQTDAAINIGNSGGALVNAYGDLVGISTLLFSRGGGSEGVGFVIPSNMARFVMESIIKYGRVIRGWMGIESQSLSASLAKAYGVNPNIGILITGVYEGGPADLAGIRRGDILIGINGQSTRDGRKVMNMVAQIPPGQSMTMQVLRDGKAIELVAQATTRPKIVN